jgi:hypothetical protein
MLNASGFVDLCFRKVTPESRLRHGRSAKGPGRVKRLCLL